MDSRLTDPASVTSWRGLSFWACCSSTGNCADLACNPPPSIHQRSLAFALPTNANLVGEMTGPRHPRLGSFLSQPSALASSVAVA